jgi:Protein of unknown function (DUF3175)
MKNRTTRKRAARKPRKWSQQVTETSDAMTLEPHVFTKGSARAIAASVKRSAERSGRRRSSPYRSAISMLTFYLNRAGENLAASRRHILERAKAELRRLFGRDKGSAGSGRTSSRHRASTSRPKRAARPG